MTELISHTRQSFGPWSIFTFSLCLPPPPVCVSSAHGEAVSLGQPPGQWLGFRGDVLGPGPPQRERDGCTWVGQPRLTPEETLF